MFISMISQNNAGLLYFSLRKKAKISFIHSSCCVRLALYTSVPCMWSLMLFFQFCTILYSHHEWMKHFALVVLLTSDDKIDLGSRIWNQWRRRLRKDCTVTTYFYLSLTSSFSWITQNQRFQNIIHCEINAVRVCKIPCHCFASTASWGPFQLLKDFIIKNITDSFSVSCAEIRILRSRRKHACVRDTSAFTSRVSVTQTASNESAAAGFEKKTLCYHKLVHNRKLMKI